MKNISNQKIFRNRSKIYSKHGLKTVYVSKSGFAVISTNKQNGKIDIIYL